MSQALLPWGLAFAAGAMLYVISHEIIPETHRSGHQKGHAGPLYRIGTHAVFGCFAGLTIGRGA